MNTQDEMGKLERMLTRSDIPYQKNKTDLPLKNQLLVPQQYDGVHEEYPIVSVICNRGSFGYEEGLLEICGLLTDGELESDDVVGWLTADEVFKRIKGWWDALSDEEQEDIRMAGDTDQ